MNEYIKKEAVLDLFGEVPAYTGYETYPVGVHTLICEIAPLIKDEIRKIPAADVAPVRHGHWISLTDCSNAGVYCSVCHKKVYKEDYAWCNRKNKLRSNYCPNCGCKMSKEE